MTVILIAAVGSNGVIGRDNDLPWRIREDLQHFKQLTLGHTLVMGRKTYDSIGRPLPGRRTVVITRQQDWTVEGVEVVHTLEDALKLAVDNDLYVAGGGDVYRQALPYADRLELTEVDQAPEGDVTFPAFDRSGWRESARDPREGFSFVTYLRA
ncbi:MAG TPA: dihydrofolate reductase [Kribbella sp.]|uniref:dihydrofolate reductase n=1 Tax=Kribbella sp. TaxID=1871183 RepID=UPI002D793F39|nr:dihydrofolate reductase [Kribbella sp.]HET6295279.1 dihydrofolate reductase [Kribbella sp.]